MQVNNTPRFVRSFMIGLIASSAGTFLALPSSAMPEISEAVSASEIPQETLPEAIEELPTPVAEDNLSIGEDAKLTEADELEEETAADSTELDADTVEAADIEALSDEAIEASDTMDGEPVEAAAEEPDESVESADLMMEEEAVEAADPMEEETLEATDGDEMTDETLEADTPEAESEAAAEMNTEDFTIAELTSSSASFEILAAALAAADLTETLSEAGPYTVFAPTDEAFEALPEGAVEQLLLPENKDVLAQILSYHVVPGELFSEDLETGVISTVEGSDIAVEVGDVVTVNNANVVVPNVEASNGVIHIIDRVILPPAPAAEAEGADAVQ